MKINGAEVQPPLASGTNIQTLNTQSILTEGNLSAKVGYYFPLTPTTSNQITNVLNNYSSTAQASQPINRLILAPFIFQNSISVSACLLYTSDAADVLRV